MLLKNFTLLYVEDNYDMQNYMKSFLEEEVKEFYQAYDGKEGLTIYKDKKPDIILSDINMPRISGLNMAKTIKELDKNQPVLILSAFDDSEILKESINIGIDNFIVKPIEDIHKLLAILEDISCTLQNKIDRLLMKEELDSNYIEMKMLKERLELAYIGSQDGLWDWNIIENSIYYSPRWKEMLGYSDEELPNEVATWSDRIHPDDIEETWAGINKNVESKTEYYEGVHRLKHKDGHWVWILDRGKTMFNPIGSNSPTLGS